jgi:hypothetical protein
MRERWVIGLVVLLLSGCGGKGPQRPSQRKGSAPQADTTVLGLMEMNQQLAETADAQLHRLAREQEESYALYEQGTWVHIYDKGDTERPIHYNEEYTVHMRVYSLKGTFYMDAEQTARAGKYELPAAIDENITDWHHGASMRMIVPWYAAYGNKGTAKVPPYENVIIDLEIR